MKKIFLFFLLLTTIGATPVWAQCDQFGFYLDLEGFVCDEGPGNICFVTNADWVDVQDCGDYVVELEFPTGSFIYTNLDDFYLDTITQATTKLWHEPELIYDIPLLYGCLEGVLQVPGTVFTLRIVSMTNPNDVLSVTTFTLDQPVHIGSPGQTTYLTDVIGPGMLLNPAQANTMAQTVLVEGTFVIDTPYTFGASLGGKLNEIAMQPGARIEVIGGVQFGTRRANIHGCGSPWDRINVQSGGAYSLYGTEITDAAVAIELQDASALTMQLLNMHDNETGIASLGPNLKNISITLYSNWLFPSSIWNGKTGCRFENVGHVDLIGSLFFYNHENEGVYLDHTNFNGAHLGFHTCHIGVNSATSNQLLTLDDCSFTKGQFGVLSLGSAEMEITGSGFTELDYGIGRGSTVVNEHSLLENNTMEGCGMDVLAVVQPSRAEVQFNNLIANYSNVVVLGYGAGSHKWAIQHNTNMFAGFNFNGGVNVGFINVKDGRIFRNIDAFSTDRNILVSGGSDVKIGYNNTLYAWDNENINFSGSPKGVIYCNTTDGNTGLVFTNTCTGTDVRGNTMTSSGFNLSYGTPANVFATTGPQPYKGNLFDASSSSNPKAVNYSDLATAQLNQYQVGFFGGAQGTAYYPYFTSAFNKWFDKDENGLDYDCPPGFASPDPTGIEKLRSAAATNIAHLGAGIGNTYGSEVAFDLKLKLCRYLDELKNLDPLTATEQTWYNAFKGTAVGNAIAFESIFNQAAALSPSEESQANQLSQQIRDLRTDLNAIEWYSLNNKTQTVEIHAAEKAEFDEIRKQLRSQTSALGALLNNRQMALMDVLDDLAVANAGITGTEVSAQNLRIVNGLLIARLSPGFTAFSGSELQTLGAIANQCAGLGGEGVYTARALLADATKSAPGYRDECIPGNTPRMDQSPSADAVAGISVAPNPASDMAVVTFAPGHSCTGLTVNDLLGRLISTVKTEPGATEVLLHTASWQPGIYILLPENSDFPPVKLIIER